MLLIAEEVRADFSFHQTPLKEVISQIQEQTPYYFLYRESMVAGIRITLDSTEDEILDDLKRELVRHDILLEVNYERNQVILTRLPSETAQIPEYSINGNIVDAQTGERLPFATVSWNDEGKFSGVAANAAGFFRVAHRFSKPEISLTVSYVGYQSRQVQIDLTSPSVSGLTIRLQPAALTGNEIVISGFMGANPADTLLNSMMDAARFSPLGEANSVRALQAHPSVAGGTALNNGINVRGSNPDGFLVLLDDMTIFNQTHLFGLLDSFNPDAILSAGYYFGVTPADIEVPTGGTLNLITRTGSMNAFQSSAGISNTGINATIHGPLGERSSWLLSARTSFIDQVSWFGNADLIQWGLDINRRKRLAADEPDFTDLVLRPEAPSARFLDLHGKLYFETPSAGRLILSGYLGGNQISQKAGRRTRSLEESGAFIFEDVKTSNQWGNAVMSMSWQREFGNQMYGITSAGFSIYETDFEKDDFVYSRVNSSAGSESVTIFTYPFRNRSSMNEFKIKQQIELSREFYRASAGLNWNFYQGDYSETSFDRSSFFTRTTAHLANAYLQTDWNPFSSLEVNTGGRVYFYSPGSRFLFSPRVRLRFSPVRQVNLTGGYAINHQFLHRVSLANATTADVWVLSTENQPPAESTMFSAGVEFIPSGSLYLKVEAYHKRNRNIRTHELNTRSLENTFSGSPLIFSNRGESNGIEVLLRNRLGRFLLTQTYALSKTQLRNPLLQNSQSFSPEWDRTHTYQSVLETRLTRSLNLYLSWLMMSGAPNQLAIHSTENQERLDAYYRLDLTISWQHTFANQSKIEADFSIFNLLNRENVWYRDYAFTFDETRSVPRLYPVPVDVLDLGFHPSFNLKFSF